MSRTRLFDSVAALVLIFGVIGSYLGGWVGGFIGYPEGAVVGALVGCVVAGGIGLSAWEKRHRHNWQRGAVYDNKGKPRFMIKFCECGEICFDGLFSKEEGKGNVGEWISVPLKPVEETNGT